MARTTSQNELIPSARRLVTSLRDLGYDFSAAVADLVDNSIEAGAKRVSITIMFDGTDSWVRIADNGKGMSLATLTGAMRYGSERDYQDDDLGKFGLGLKTASLSQCRRLTVGSRCATGTGKVAALCWDISHIQEINRWEVIRLNGKLIPVPILEALSNKKGTVVLWEQLDRMLGYEYPYGEYAKRRLFQMCRELEEHLAMVFHRYLSGEVKNRKLTITINDNEVKPWDPFARTEKHPSTFKPISIPVDKDGLNGEIVLQPYVLPHQDKFSSTQAHSDAAGPNKWNRQQGFYIYRADRLIQSGGWSGLRTLDEHTKLARVALSFSPRLDEAFKINVAKMRVQLPPYTKEAIDKALGPVLRVAQNEYRKGGKKSPSFFPSSTASAAVSSPESISVPSVESKMGKPSGNTFLQDTSGINNGPSPANPSVDANLEDLCMRLLDLANNYEKIILVKLFEKLGFKVDVSD